MQNVVVAGGAGFIGSHLCELLLREKYAVFCIDDLITGSIDNVKHLQENADFHFIDADVTSDKPVLPKIAAVFHLASPASPNKNSPKSYINKPIETLLANSIGTKGLLDLAREDGAKFLFASSSEVYGDPAISPQVESYWGNVNPNGVRSVYDEAKRFGEAMVMAYVRNFDVDARIIRIFNTYGPRMQKDDGRVVSNFIVQSLSGEDVTVYGKGEQTRSFCFVSDMVEGLFKAMFTGHTKGEVMNMGNPDERSIQELATIIRTLIDSSGKIVYETLPEDDPRVRKPAIEKAQKLLSWEPRVSLEEGLRKTIEYFKTCL